MKQEKRVLILPSWYPPDGGGFFKDHAEALNYENFKVDVLVNRILGISRHPLKAIIFSGRIIDSMEGSLRVIRSAYVRWPGLERANVKGWVNRYLELFEYYRDKYGEPDIIIAHSSIWAGYVASLIEEKYGIPYILVEHRSRFARDIEATQKMIREWYFPFIRRSLTYAGKIVTVSEAIDNQLISISPGIRNKIITIPNLIDTEFFCPPTIPRQKQPFVFLGFGILEDVKGFDILIEAFANFVRKHDGEFFLRIGGRGGKFRKLKALSRKLGVEDLVTLHGYVPRIEVKHEMELANLFILPSRFEAFGVVLIEAMATGCPVISTYSGGPESIVKDPSGILVEPEDPVGLETAMERIYDNYSSYNPDEIRSSVVQNYSVGAIRKKYHNLIQEILHEKVTSSDE